MMRQQQTMQNYVYWALNSPVPEFTQSSAYVYYSPYRRGVIPQGFHTFQEALLIDHLQASGLIPATMQARVQLALSYHEARDGGRAMVWNHDETGELIDLYENIGLWGATTFNKQGKMGTVLAQKREILIERALQDQVIPPRPNALKHIRQLPGMKEISPVLLPRGEGPVLEILERYEIQAASDREPLYPPSEWLVTLLYEDRIMALEHTSSTLPTVIRVVQTLCTRMLLFEECGGDDCWTDEDVPSFVYEKQRQDLQDLLGTDYHDFLPHFAMSVNLPGFTHHS